MKGKIYLVLVSLLSILTARAQSSLGETNLLSETLFSEKFTNVIETSKQLIPADMSHFDNADGWILNKVYAGENCIKLTEGSSISFPTVKGLTGNGMFEIDASPWYVEPDGDDPNFDWEAFEENQMKAGAYHMTIENGELLTSEFDLKMSMIGAPNMYDVSSNTRLTLHADGPLIINAINIGYGKKLSWTQDPEFNHEPGVYYAPFDLIITPGKSSDGYLEKGEHNFSVFTTDGTCPDRRSQKVDGPIHIDKTTTVWVATIHGNGLMTVSDAKVFEIIGQGTNVEIPAATYEINVDKPGSLKNKILAIDADEINGLVIHGKINSEDLAYLNSGTGRMGFLTYLDLGDVTFDYDKGRYKTRVFAPEGGMGTVTTIHYHLSETNYEEGLGGGPMSVNLAYYCNDLSSAFVGHPKLELVVWPEFMTTTGTSTFENCESLVQFKHSGNLTEIGHSAFYNCKNLNNIDLSSTIKVGNTAFWGTMLRGEVDFSNMDEIGDASFSGTKISSIKFGSPSHIGMGAFSSTLLKRLDLPNPPDTIPESAFACFDNRTYEHPLKTVVLGEGVRYIGKNAFGDGVEEMNLPSTIEELEEDALPEKIVAKIEPEDGIRYIGKIAYKASEVKSSYTIKEGTVSIADGAFAFWNSNEIQEINLPASLEVIGKRAFQSTGLKRTPEMKNVREIKDGAFSWCPQLARVVIPESLEKIGSGVFDHCNSLWYLEYNAIDLVEFSDFYFRFPKNVEQIVLGDKVRVIPSGLFQENSNITEVTLPASVEVIDDYAFYLCSNLKDLYMTDNLTTIGASAFSYCYNLKDFHWPAKLKAIGGQAFRECTSLKTISLPEGMEFIDGDAFFCCSGVESVYIASSISEFGSDPFDLRNTDKAFTITAPSKEPQPINWNWHYFGTPTIKVPAESVEAYKADPYWSGAINMKDNLIIPIEEVSAPTESSETTFADIDEDTDLGDTVIGDVYVTLGEDDSYDAEDGSIVLASVMEDEFAEILGDLAPGQSDLANRFNGLVVKVNAGEGTVKIDCQTIGANLLSVKIGDAAPLTFTKDVKGYIEVEYNVAKDTYIYIYGSLPKPEAQTRKAFTRGAEDGCIRLYSVLMEPNMEQGAVESVGEDLDSIFGNSDARVDIYTSNGILIERNCTRDDLRQLPPAIYILRNANGKSKVFFKTNK